MIIENMNELAMIIFGVLAILVIYPTLKVLNFISLFHSPSLEPVQDEALPKAAIVLSLRGADPFLTDCVHALLNQNYPQYKVHIVIDSQEDPAWKIVNDTILQEQAINVQVNPLIFRHDTCSLKCSALVQAISQLDDSYEVVALLDADVVAHPNWLRELVAPLADNQVGATTGNRWYIPQIGKWGSLVRYMWNAAAVIFMYIYQCPWGGSMALKLSVLRKAQLLETWKQGVSVDTPIHKALREIGLKVKFVPSVMMSNREECNFAQCLRFITRQLLVARLYNPNWIVIASAVFISTLALLMIPPMLLFALINSNFDTAILIVGGAVSYILGMALLLALGEQGVRRVLRDRGEPTESYSVLMMAKILIAIPLTQLVYAVTTISAILAQSVEWRGITYQIKDAWNIRLTKYYPYQNSNKPLDTNVSL
ncbi:MULTISPECIES: glycosyltransferase family 2 protein [unclassified Nodularia (in: cyanobacteria)]|uniref:glycosyltransferase n=1 Tax=unclassified Nodularia (in: cyanobacteria) TaxID=2656917 RepID=UPI001D121928|nr:MULTISPECIES: glycosyltransferase family 2 protein [unclassified Nodularia (in: cyanobacteria)]